MSHRYKSLRDKLAECTEESASILREKIMELQRDEESYGKRINDKYKANQIIINAKLSTSPSTFSRFLEGGKLPEEVHKKLAHYMVDDGVFSKPKEVLKKLQDIDDPLFHSLVNFLKVKSGTIESTISAFPGIYKIWRPSLHWHGQYVVASLEIYHDEHVVKTMETQRFSGIDGEHSLMKQMEGYLFKKNGKIYILSSENNENKSLQLIIVNSASFGKDKKVVVMEGMMIGIFHGEIISTMVYIERWNNPPDDSTDFYKALDIVPPDDVHPLIRSRLGRFKLEDGFAFIK
jgi:hypothetical protein